MVCESGITKRSRVSNGCLFANIRNTHIRVFEFQGVRKLRRDRDRGLNWIMTTMAARVVVAFKTRDRKSVV